MTTIQERSLPIDTFLIETSKQGRREAEAMRDYLIKLPEKGWLSQSFCTDWTIKDVAEHQAAQGSLFLSNARAILAGKEPQLFNPAAIQKQADELKGLNRLELAERIATTTHDLFDLLEKASPEQLQRSTQTPLGQLNLALLGSIRLSELSLHSWDVRVVNDLTAKVSRESLPLLFPGLVTVLPALAHSQTVKQLKPLTYQFEINGPVKGPLALAVADGKVQTRRDYADKPDVILKLDSDAFLRLSWGRLRLDWMIRDGWVKVEGDTDAALKLNELFRGI